MPILDPLVGTNLQSALWVLLGAVGQVLLVACANVANLLLARGAARQQGFAVRAPSWRWARLMRQLVAESCPRSGAGGVGGMLIAWWGTRVLAVAAAAYVPRIDEIAVDARVLWFAAAASIVAGLVFRTRGVSRLAIDASEALKEAGLRHGRRPASRRSRGALIVAECSLAIVLLAGAGLC